MAVKNGSGAPAQCEVQKLPKGKRPQEDENTTILADFQTEDEARAFKKGYEACQKACGEGGCGKEGGGEGDSGGCSPKKGS